MPAEFTDSDDLRGARFTSLDLSGAVFRDVVLVGARFIGPLMQNVEIDGIIDGMRVNGVEVAPLVEAELNRRDPERVKIFTATDPDRVRDAWDLIERRWAAAVDRALALPEPMLFERVDDEWSFTETLRHLIFVTDAWIRRTVLGERDPYCPFGVVHSAFRPAGSGIDPDARPTLDEVLAARAERMAIARSVLADLTPEQFAGTCEPNPAPGYPSSADQPVFMCIAALLSEEWAHLGYARRDLATLERRAGLAVGD